MVTLYFGVAVAVIQHVQGTCKNRRNVSMALFGLSIVSVFLFGLIVTTDRQI